MRARSLLVLVLGAVAAASVGLAEAPDAEARKRCGKVSGNGMTVRVVVHRGRIACWRARRIVRRNFLYEGRNVRGWFCFTAHGPSSYAGVCAPTGQDPDTARRVIRVY